MTKVGVLMGGLSKEREISLKTGLAVLEALKRKGHNALGVDCGRDLPSQLKKENIEAAFICLHGPLGEDGCVQGLLEWMQIPYTGSGVLASALGMDKAVLNALSRDLGFIVPKEEIFDRRHETVENFLKRLELAPPLMVKPSREGSTINTTVVRKSAELKAAMETALKSDCKVLVEAFIAGKEVTVGVLNGKALPSIEIAPKSGFYDYSSKYTKGMTEYILPARISPACESRLADISEHLFRAIDCSGVVRCDFIVNGKNETPYFLEVNTIPGMTATSLVPKAAAHAGISFEDLCEAILKTASLKVEV